MPTKDVLNVGARTSAASATHYPSAGVRTETVTDGARRARWQLVRGGANIEEYLHLLSQAITRLFWAKWRESGYAGVGGSSLHPSGKDPRLALLLDLKNNWDGYGAEPPNHVASYHAEWVLSLLNAYPAVPDRVVPSAEGGISLVFTSGNKVATLELLNTGEILVSLVKGREDAKVSEVTLPFVGGALERICAHIG